MSADGVQAGCEVLCAEAPSWFTSQRLGLLANQASVGRSFTHASQLIHGHGGNLTCLFAPQHGYCAEKQANMQESADCQEPALRVPVFSLYGAVREPTAAMLEKIDVLLIDLQDVGTRVYTYGTTMGLCMEAAARYGVRVVILDRPNPIGGELVEGNLVQDGFRSFVGRYALPMRHGLTMGELARYLVAHCHVSCELEVIPAKGWRREYYHPDTNRAWIFPSPNMPVWETALVYPGLVLLEGTNVSEGRGTTLPFQLFGAPFFDLDRVGKCLNDAALEGVHFRPLCFEPCFDKWAGRTCYGFQIHVTDRKAFRPYRLGLTLLRILLQIHGNDFRWLPPPYEYEWNKRPIDILLGDSAIRERLEAGDAVSSVEADWTGELAAYRERVEQCLLYQ